jgi:hypothetical protein
MVHGPSRDRAVGVGRLLLLTLLTTLLVVCLVACGSTESTQPTGTSVVEPTTAPPDAATAIPGTITASVAGITGQQGKSLAISVYDFDWAPGSPNTQVAVFRTVINSDDFSTSAVLSAVGADGNPTAEPATLQPGEYSVVFFIVPAGQAPEKFTEVRVTVAGDIQVQAPAWGTW